MILKSVISIVLGVIALIFVVAAMTALSNNDGISTDLAGALIAPVQLIHNPQTDVFFEAGGFHFGEDEAIKLTVILAVIFSLIGLFMCILAAKRRVFTPAYSVAFLFCVSALVLGFFKLGHLLYA